MGCWVVGLLCCCFCAVVVLLGCCVVVLLGCWVVGLLGCWVVVVVLSCREPVCVCDVWLTFVIPFF